MVIWSFLKIRHFLKSLTLKTKENDWANLSDVKMIFRTVDYVGNDLYVFNIGGNKYRLIARIRYDYQVVNVRAIVTHEEYDRGAWKD